MALIKCKECGSQVSSKAEACPKCGVKVKKKTGCLTKIFVFLLVLFAFGAFVSSLVPSSHSSDSSSRDLPGESSLIELKKAAEQGDSDAQYKLSEAYFGGDGVAKDRAESTKWCRKAAEQGHVRAQFGLGMSYYNGYGVPVNKAEAVNWWKKAAEQGDAAAQRTLASRLRDGDGVTMNKSEAFNWWKKAAEQGDSDGWYHLGLSYKDGVGIAKDHVEAYKWIYLFHLSWDPKTWGDWSVADLRDLEQVMSASEVAEGKKRANEWRSAHPEKKSP